MVKGLIRNPKDRNLVRLVSNSRFIATSDLYLLDGRGSKEVSDRIKALRIAKHLQVVSSAQRLPKNFYARKTYVLTVGQSPRGHCLHWCYIAHLKALFTVAARELGIPFKWHQSQKHKNDIPDFIVTLDGQTYNGELDNGTERLKADRIAGKLASVTTPTLVVVMSSKARMESLAGCVRDWSLVRMTYHGWWHDQEREGFNLASERVWWDGRELIDLVQKKELTS